MVIASFPGMRRTVRVQNAGNDAFTVSTAALSFTSMEMMLQSMVAVKTTAKSEVLFMAVSFPMKAGVLKLTKRVKDIFSFFFVNFGKLKVLSVYIDNRDLDSRNLFV